MILWRWRGEDRVSGPLFFYVDVEGRIPLKHPWRVTNKALAELDGPFSSLYEACGRPSIPPEQRACEGRSASNNMKSEGKRPLRRTKTSKMAVPGRKKIAPAPSLAKTQ
jgi:hypothetical protein